MHKVTWSKKERWGRPQPGASTVNIREKDFPLAAILIEFTPEEPGEEIANHGNNCKSDVHMRPTVFKIILMQRIFQTQMQWHSGYIV